MFIKGNNVIKNLIYSSLLLLIFSVILNAPALAQEKQSDANWEETVEFIEKYISSIKDTQIWDYIYERDMRVKVEDISIAGPNMHVKVTNNDREYLIIIPLLRISSFDRRGISTVSDDITIEEKFRDFSDNLVKRKKSTTSLRFWIPDDEMRPRLIKAFQHLAYLATEYREEQRKASGDAF